MSQQVAEKLVLVLATSISMTEPSIKHIQPLNPIPIFASVPKSESKLQGVFYI